MCSVTAEARVRSARRFLAADRRRSMGLRAASHSGRVMACSPYVLANSSS